MSMPRKSNYRVFTGFLSLVFLFSLFSLTISASGSMVAQELPKADDITIDLDDYYGQKIEGYYNLIVWFHQR
jgi:hypothetical protein